MFSGEIHSPVKNNNNKPFPKRNGRSAATCCNRCWELAPFELFWTHRNGSGKRVEPARANRANRNRANHGIPLFAARANACEERAPLGAASYVGGRETKEAKGPGKSNQTFGDTGSMQIPSGSQRHCFSTRKAYNSQQKRNKSN